MLSTSLGHEPQDEQTPPKVYRDAFKTDSPDQYSKRQDGCSSQNDAEMSGNKSETTERSFKSVIN